MLLKCTTCRNLKPDWNFTIDKSTKNKKSRCCRRCNIKRCRAYKKANKSKLKISFQNYNEINKAQLKESRKGLVTSNRTKYNHLIKCADKRNLQMLISFEQYVKLISKKECAYCESELPRTGHGLDRKNNDLGYTLDNVLPCCSHCNFIKQDYISYALMYLIGPLAKKDREGKMTVFVFPK